MKILNIFILYVFMSAQAHASELFQFYNGIRAQGMGGVQVATVNDETALLANPAALGKVRDFFGTIVDPELVGSTSLWGMYFKSHLSDPTTPDGTKQALQDTPDTYLYFKDQVFPSIVVRNFGIGLLYRNEYAGIYNSTSTTMNVHYLSDEALVLGYSFRFFDGRIKLGFNAKFISRVEVENTAVDPTKATDLASLATEGAGLSKDVGLILTAPWTALPTLAVVVHDVGGTQYNMGSGLRLTVANRPPDVAQDADVGIAFFPIHSNYVRSSISAEVKNALTMSTDTDPTRHYHLGWELNLRDLFFVRAGWNQRYWTAGLEFASEHMQVQFSSYGEEIGTVSAPQEDRRTGFKIAFRF